MKKLIAFLAAFLLAYPAYPQFNPPNSGPYRSLVQSAGADCIFALHTDSISGMACANTSVDGTTETAFAHGVTIPAGGLSKNTIGVNSTFLIHTSAGSPSITFGLRMGGINGALIFRSVAATTTASRDYAVAINCTITALATASSSTPLAVACSNTNGISAVVLGVNQLLSSTTQSIPANTLNSPVLVWTVIYSANTAGNAIGLYSMFNGIK